MEKKYKLVEPAIEEMEAFNKDLQEISKKHSMQIDIVPQFKPNQDTKAFEVVGMLLLQKVVEDTEEGIISPIQSNDITPQA